ncbi:cadherin-86C-like isoform X2 [Tachypleus tridentatus]|uniref:cadherin-86C-like isoform X2 n=1 Tax=Tachypleus tridentatus TaxID=6853 RepID=UPI003FD01EAA
MSDVRWMFLLLFTVSTAATSPDIEVSYNMRHLQLPKDTKPGTIIYRLRGFDADNDVLTFAVRGTGASELLHVQSVSPTEANVILKSSPTRNRYEYTIFISDGSETSLAPSTIVFTEVSNVPSPFLEYEPVITLAEDTTLNEVIGYVIAKEKEISNLPVSFEIQGSEIFAIKYMFGPRGSSKAEISIVGDLDYEKADFVRFKVLALNAWTNSTVDTRNVATVDIVIIVEDVQDVPPIFIDLPPVITIAESSEPGEGLAAVKAVDGDTTNQNNITYSLEPDSPLTSFFTINSTTGRIELLKTLDELRSQYGDCSTLLFLGVKAKESTTLSSSSETTTEIALFLTNPPKQTNPATDMTTTSDASGSPNQCIPVAPSHSASNESGQSAANGINHAPRFTNQIYTGVIEENSFLQTPLQWTGASVPQVIDDDEGNNATFELYLEGGNQTFQVIPSSGTKTVDFRLLVRIPANLDYDNREIKYIDMEIVARETRSAERYSARAKIKISILDSNDNIPQFTKNIFEAQIPEDAQPGTFVAKIQATDSDTGDYGRIRYTTINGPIAQLLDLNPETGEVTLKSSSGLDRENVPEYTLTIEARDDLGRGNRNVTRLVLRLLDVNDNKPAFARPRYDVILNSELSGFDRRIFISAQDPDTVETSSKLTYRILSGPHSDRFNIDQTTGELTLIRPFASDGQSTTTSVVLQVQADDGGQQSTVEVQVHTQDYLNRTIYFVIPRPVDDVKTRKGDIARSLSTLIGSKVLIYSLEPFEGDQKKTLAKAWVSFPQKSTVNIEDMQLAVSNIYGRQYSQEEEIREKMVKKKDYDIIFWLFIALVILVFLILLICCCCWRWCCVYSKGTCSNIEHLILSVVVQRTKKISNDRILLVEYNPPNGE